MIFSKPRRAASILGLRHRRPPYQPYGKYIALHAYMLSLTYDKLRQPFKTNVLHLQNSFYELNANSTTAIVNFTPEELTNVSNINQRAMHLTNLLI